MIKTFSVEKISVKEINNGDFLSLKLYAISDGLNRNDSEFLRESFEECIPTIYNKPILCLFDKDLNDAREHNSKVAIDEEGVVYDSYLGENERAVGSIPEGAKISVEMIDGKSWIVIDGAVIWTEYNRELVKLLKKQKKKKVSVEVMPIESYEKDGIFYFKKWKFLGITILGKHEDGSLVEEGIEGAKLLLSDYIESIKFKKFNEKLSFALTHDDKNDILSKYGVKKHSEFSVTTKRLSELIEIELDESYQDQDCVYRRYGVVDFYIEENKALLYDYMTRCYYFVDYEITGEDTVAVKKETVREVEQVYVEKYSTPPSPTLIGSKSSEFSEEDIEKTGLTESKKEEKMKKFIESAKDSGFTFVGLFGSKLRFVKSCPVADEAELAETEKFSVFEIEKEKCEEEFKEEDFAELEMSEHKEVMEDDDDDEDEEEDKEDDKDEDEGEEDKVDEEKEELSKELEATKTELAEVKKELKEFKRRKFIEEVEDVLSEEDELLVDEKKSLMSLVEEEKVSDITEFTKELAYLKYTKVDRTKAKEKNKFSVSVNKQDKNEKVVDRLDLV